MNGLGELRVACLVSDGFELVELLEPRQDLNTAGAETAVVSPRRGIVRGWNLTEWGDVLPVDVPLAQARAEEFDALVLPGGVINPDALRVDADAVAFVRAFCTAAKSVAAICHGPWTIVETGYARGRRITSWPSLQTDLRNAGAAWVDEPAVVDHGLLTSRSPDDLPVFIYQMLSLFAEPAVATPDGAVNREEKAEQTVAPAEVIVGVPLVNGHPRIARIWRGHTARERADEYLRYWQEEGGLHLLADTALAVQMLREDHGDTTEFVTIF